MRKRTLPNAAVSGTHDSTQTLTAAPLTPTVAPDFRTLDEACQELRLSERTVRAWTRKRVIPSIKPPGGRRVLYYWPDVVRALRSMAS